MPSSAIALASAAGSYLLTRRTVPPTIRVMMSNEMPTMCEIGSTTYDVSPEPIRRKCAVVLALTSRFSCVSITPFGVPVVPDV